MKIERIETFLLHPGNGKNLLFCRVETDDGLHGWGRSGLNRLGSLLYRSGRDRRQRAAANRAGIGTIGLGSRDRLRVAGIGLGAGGIAARPDDLALIGGRGGHEVVDAAETRDLGAASGGHSRQEKDGRPLGQLQSITLQNTDLHGNDPRILWTQLS